MCDALMFVLPPPPSSSSSAFLFVLPPLLILIVSILAVSVRCLIWFRPHRRSAAPSMADAANDPVPSIAATGVAGGSDLTPADRLWKCVQHLLSQGAAYRRKIAGLEDQYARLETVQKSTQHELDGVCRRHQRGEATIQNLQSMLEAQNLQMKSDAQLLSDIRIVVATSAALSFAGKAAALPGSSQPGEAAPPSPARSAVPEATPQPAAAPRLRPQSKRLYARRAFEDIHGLQEMLEEMLEEIQAARNIQKLQEMLEEIHGLERTAASLSSAASGSCAHSGTIASASGSSAVSSGSSDGVPSPAAEAVLRMRDDTEDGGPPNKKSKQVARK